MGRAWTWEPRASSFAARRPPPCSPSWGCTPPPRTAGPGSSCRPSRRAPTSSRPSGGCTGFLTTPTWGSQRTLWLPTSSPSSGRRPRAGPRRTPTFPAPWAPAPGIRPTWPPSSPPGWGPESWSASCGPSSRASTRPTRRIWRPMSSCPGCGGPRRSWGRSVPLWRRCWSGVGPARTGRVAGAWTRPSRAGCSGSLTRCARPLRPAAGACAPAPAPSGCGPAEVRTARADRRRPPGGWGSPRRAGVRRRRTSRCPMGRRRSWPPTASSWPARRGPRCGCCGGFPACPRARRS